MQHTPHPTMRVHLVVKYIDQVASSSEPLPREREKFIENNVYTATQGLHHFMANGDLFVESQEKGKIYLFNENETLIKRYYNEPLNNHIEHTHWIRIYEELDFIN